MEQKNKETRNTTHQVRNSEDSRMIEGYALLFDTPSDGLPFEETIERGALDGVIARSDVFALMNHDMTRGILARSKHGNGSMQLSIDEVGLLYRFEAPHTALGDELLENIRRGEVDQSSFCFSVAEDTWAKKEDGTWHRSIHRIEALYDVSPVYDAAYSATSVCMRGKEIAEAEMQRLSAPDESYYTHIENSLNI